jgi:hypothetical protein
MVEYFVMLWITPLMLKVQNNIKSEAQVMKSSI